MGSRICASAVDKPRDKQPLTAVRGYECVCVGLLDYQIGNRGMRLAAGADIVRDVDGRSWWKLAGAVQSVSTSYWTHIPGNVALVHFSHHDNPIRGIKQERERC